MSGISLLEGAALVAHRPPITEVVLAVGVVEQDSFYKALAQPMTPP